MSADQDRQDIEHVLGGDPTAFEGIVRRWQGPLVNLAWRFCRDRGRAEDLAQEAFLQAFRGLPSISPSARFTARVMDVVRTEAATPPPIPFPWRRLLIAPALGLLLCVLAGAQAPEDMQLPTATLLATLSRWANGAAEVPRVWAPAMLAVGTLAGSLLIAGVLQSLAGLPARSRHTV